MASKQDKKGGAKSASPGQTDREDAPFDERLELLEGIVRELEDGGLGLERSIERYQEGIELLKGCHGTLESYRARVEELGREAESVLTPLADDPDFPAGHADRG